MSELTSFPVFTIHAQSLLGHRITFRSMENSSTFNMPENKNHTGTLFNIYVLFENYNLRIMINFANKFPVIQQIFEVDNADKTRSVALWFCLTYLPLASTWLPGFLSDKRSKPQNVDLHPALSIKGSDRRKGWSNLSQEQVTLQRP